MPLSRQADQPLSFSRRWLFQATASSALAASAFASTRSQLMGQETLMDELVIDLSAEPATLDPVLTYEVNGWSIVHAIYDAPIQYGPEGQLEMLAAESLTFLDPQSLEIRLRPGITFHDGTPLTSASIARTVEHLAASESQIKGNFSTITGVETPDELTAVLTLSTPSPWLPAQVALWLTCLSPPAIDAGTVAETPVGTGPYRFLSWERGERITLEANPNYPLDSVKGRPIAERVVYRFVPEATTRVADLLSGAAQVVRSLPVSQIEQVEGEGQLVKIQPLSGNAWIRIPTDIAPFSDVRVRQALNHAVDVEAIIAALLGGQGRRLANFFVPTGLGFDETLAPYTYEPERARSLLKEAGVGDGFSTQLAYATTERKDLLEVIAAQLSDVGIEVELVAQEPAIFNGEWTSQDAPALRFATWRPMDDPFNLLNLVVSTPSAGGGFLSRHTNEELQPLIEAAAVENDPSARAGLYRQLGVGLHEQPAAIYLWSLTGLYGVAQAAAAWTPRPDDYVIPTTRG